MDADGILRIQLLVVCCMTVGCFKVRRRVCTMLMPTTTSYICLNNSSTYPLEVLIVGMDWCYR
jgi:hypothetical protein